MELAVHVRNLDGLARAGDLPHGWATGEGGLGGVSRVYVGDEFCFHRLPNLAAFKALLRAADAHGYGLTLLTPVLTDPQMAGAAPLFAHLGARRPDTEVVFNDWGVMTLLREEFGLKNLSAGRVLNKGFKDPRLGDAASIAAISPEARELLNSGTFHDAGFQRRMQALQVRRLEYDLPPYADDSGIACGALPTAVYFPFGCVTSGRVCWMAGFGRPLREKFVPAKVCARPCSTVVLKLASPGFELPVFQNGNTVFYRYDNARLSRLFAQARSQGLRLVYQGEAMGIP
jgi:hypothetical protein